jgi:hypothetical protein
VRKRKAPRPLFPPAKCGISGLASDIQHSIESRPAARHHSDRPPGARTSSQIRDRYPSLVLECVRVFNRGHLIWLETQRGNDPRASHQPGPRGALPSGATRVDRMRRKLQTKAGAAIYGTRKTVVESVFRQIKQARGFRQFLLRGLGKTQGEWALSCLTHNILKLEGLCYGQKRATAFAYRSDGGS